MSIGAREPPFGFQVLLASFVLLLFVPGLFYGENISLMSRMVGTLVLVASLYIVVNRSKDFIIGVALAVPTLLTDWLPVWFVSESAQLLAYCIFKSSFQIYISYHVFRYLVNARQVDSDIISAAICLYLLTGMTWALVYFGIVLLDPNAINLKVDSTLTDRDSVTHMLQELIYFSYVTQTTLGYGELTPASGVARAFVIAQSLFGQIYIAVVIARLVGLQIATATADQQRK